MELPFIDPIVGKEIPRWKHEVLKKDKDKVIIVDGREGCGKSVLAQQLAAHLDPNFNIDKIAYTAEQFMAMIRDPKRLEGDCIILDEAFLAANSRSAMSQINRAMVGLATEMRQLNLFVIICLPSFFDLDKYFALWRTDLLVHVYYDKKGNRGRYIMWSQKKKKQLYLNGKKFYNYGCVKSPYPPCRFRDGYMVDEHEYRLRKQKAFREVKMKKRDVKILLKLAKAITLLHDQFKMKDREIGEELDYSRSWVRDMRHMVVYGGQNGVINNTNLLNLGSSEPEIPKNEEL